MKGKKHSEFDTPTFFSGKCEKCAEVYEAQSKTDDLEGITFKCKKVLCQGRVTLGVGKPQSVGIKGTSSFPEDLKGGSSNSPRYC